MVCAGLGEVYGCRSARGDAFRHGWEGPRERLTPTKEVVVGNCVRTGAKKRRQEGVYTKKKVILQLYLRVDREDAAGRVQHGVTLGYWLPVAGAAEANFLIAASLHVFVCLIRTQLPYYRHLQPQRTLLTSSFDVGRSAVSCDGRLANVVFVFFDIQDYNRVLV